MAVSAEKVVTELWKEYARTKSTETRNEILMNYVHIVKNVVYRMVPSYSRFVDIDDLMSCGVIGLMDAISRYDINKGTDFESFAYYRVKGEIIDYLRKQDFISANLRQKIKNVEKAFETIEAQTGRAATEEEVSSYLNIDINELRKLLEDSYTYNIISLDEILANAGVEPASGNLRDLPEKRVEKEELRRLLKEGIRSLSDRERLVITLYYFEGMTLKEIGLTLDVSESRVSQIHSRALIKLRNKLKSLI